ncbi:MAG: 4Fe-4S binding protein [Promethearchaeota archaeon]
MSRLLGRPGVKVLVVDEECALVRGRRNRRKLAALERAGHSTSRVFYSTSGACTKCDECFIRLGCPPIVVAEDDDGNELYDIDQVRCEGEFCGACAQVCPNNAIKKTEINPHLAGVEDSGRGGGRS